LCLLDIHVASFFNKERLVKYNFLNRHAAHLLGVDSAIVSQVQENFRLAFGAKKLIVLKEIHSNLVIEVDDSTLSNSLEADAMVTAVPLIALSIYTADCTPILVLYIFNGLCL
jgi:copper oxidase (laccase) domain-containing protein